MENPLLEFMVKYWTEEEVKWYNEMLDTIGGIYPDWLDNYDTYFDSLDGNRDIQDMSMDIHSMIRNQLTELLLNMGFIVSDEYDIDNIVLFKIYRELLEIDKNEQTDYILSILEEDNNPEDIFYEVLTTVGGLDVDESLYHQHIQKVSPFTVKKFIHFLKEKTFSEDVPVPTEYDNIKASERFKAFMEKLNDSNFYVVDLIRNGMKLGLSFRHYMDLYWSDISQLDNREITYNLYLLGVSSIDGLGNEALVVHRNISNYIPDPYQQDIICRAISELHLKLGQ